jgi:histidinol-phosphate aminotransferase
MSHEYRRPVSGGGLRLHLNENTAGCSPRVIDAIRALTREDAAIYPDYEAATAACATRFGVEPGHVLLTNGLDEGILLAAIVALRGSPAADPYEAVIVQPAFEMYAACADGIGGRIVDVAPRADFSFPLDRVLDALSPKTRVIYLTSPNNPTGISIPNEDLVTIGRAAPGALVFLDEAYADFAGTSMMAAAASGRPANLVVGRTFAKAYGLAGLRAGALVGTPETLAPMRRIVPPYTLNACAAAALPVALEDDEYYQWYRAEVHESKRLLYDALTRFGVPFWPSDGNFVLARFGDGVAGIIARLADRGIAIRDRSQDPGCEGCARMTAGVVDHTRRLVSALEEVLCGAR